MVEVNVDLVVPVDEEHRYFEAINLKSRRFTALGYQYCSHRQKTSLKGPNQPLQTSSCRIKLNTNLYS